MKNGVLYFINGLNVYAIDASTGKTIWQINDQTNIPPAITGGKAITAFDGYVTAFDRQTKAQIWQQTTR